ncbi:MAG: energy transducer TonB [Bacteroidetes bacterium]|nr:energy transducer TonB [Bacteroidota bacterium]MBL7104585.1 energy transducer TonB [Bacteroidales bacterium]
MKRLTIIIILLNLITSISFSQLYKTAKVKVKSGEKLIKEVYYVRKNERYIKEGMYIQFYKGVKIIEGTVYINFIITKTGELESVKIIKSVNKQLDNEVIRVINEMPRWNPGLENGIPVRVSFNLPIVFKLN